MDDEDWPPALRAPQSWLSATDDDREFAIRWMARKLGDSFIVAPSSLLPDKAVTLVHRTTGLEFAVIPCDEIRREARVPTAEWAAFAISRVALEVNSNRQPWSPVVADSFVEIQEYCRREALDIPSDRQWLRAIGCSIDPQSLDWSPSLSCVQHQVQSELAGNPWTSLGVANLLVGSPEFVEWSDDRTSAPHRTPATEHTRGAFIECVLGGAVSCPIALDDLAEWRAPSEKWSQAIGFRPAKVILGRQQCHAKKPMNPEAN